MEARARGKFGGFIEAQVDPADTYLQWSNFVGTL